MTAETWRAHPVYTTLEVSTHGRMRRVDTGSVLRGSINNRGYHVVGIQHHGKRRYLKVHRLVGQCFIDNPDNRPFVDHIDTNRSNNHASNLRWATPTENQHNRQVTGQGASSYKGVTWDKTRGKWAAKIKVDGHTRNLGRYANEKDAALAYNAAACELHGEFARLNVIDELLTARD